MKPILKKSKETIVMQWISRNRKLINASDSFMCSDLQISSIDNNTFSFEWHGISGTLTCKKRVLTNSLNLHEPIIEN